MMRHNANLQGRETLGPTSGITAVEVGQRPIVFAMPRVEESLCSGSFDELWIICDYTESDDHIWLSTCGF
jgi:hypothetical protein